MSIRHPKAFYVRQKMKNSYSWDGTIKYITEAGYLKTGHLPWLVNILKKEEIEFELVDQRSHLRYEPFEIEDLDVEVREYQTEAVDKVLENTIEGIPFQRGIINAATNAGKTMMMIKIFKSFPDANGIILINESTLYNQFLKDMPKYFEEDEWGYMQGKNLKWGKIMVAMVQTLVRNINKFQSKLSSIDIIFIDECDLSTSKTYKTILNHIYNATIRVGLSGSVFLTKLKRDDMKNNEVKEYLGEELFKIKNIQLMEMGYSTPVVVKIIEGNTKFPTSLNYPEVYRECITLNTDRTRKAVERVKFNLERGRKPLIVVCQYIEHVEVMYAAMRGAFGLRHNVSYAHHETKDRLEIFDDFRVGKIDILVVSQIVRRGKNFPLIKYILNAGGGDSSANVLQIVGRGVRKHESKSKVWVEDFWDMGKYIQDHSKHRVLTYKQEGFKIISLLTGDTIIKKKKTNGKRGKKA